MAWQGEHSVFAWHARPFCGLCTLSSQCYFHLLFSTNPLHQLSQTWVCSVLCSEHHLGGNLLGNSSLDTWSGHLLANSQRHRRQGLDVNPWRVNYSEKEQTSFFASYREIEWWRRMCCWGKTGHITSGGRGSRWNKLLKGEWRLVFLIEKTSLPVVEKGHLQLFRETRWGYSGFEPHPQMLLLLLILLAATVYQDFLTLR